MLVIPNWPSPRWAHTKYLFRVFSKYVNTMYVKQNIVHCISDPLFCYRHLRLYNTSPKLAEITSPLATRNTFTHNKSTAII